MKKILVLVTILSLSLFAFTGFASAATMAGSTELGIYGNSSSIEIETVDDPIVVTILQLSVGHFMTEALQLGLGLTSIVTEFQSYENTTTILDVYAKYHILLPDSTTVPYVGLQAGSASSDDGTNSNSSVSFGGMGGLKFFLSENTSLNLELNYRVTEYDEGYADPVEVTQTSFLFGVSYYFGMGAESAN